jgi:asparaginyl-tRNA synthetase
VKEDKRAPGGYEMDATGFRVLPRHHDYPITPKDHGTAFLMENRHLWLRSQRQHAIIRVRHAVVKACRDYLDELGFTLVDTPIFTPAACEGTTTLFGVPYFDEGTAYLTQSGQLYSEATVAAHGKVYCFGPPSARRSRRRGATSPSSGWWSPRSPSRTSTTRWPWPRASSAGGRARAGDAAGRAEGLERDTAKLENVKPRSRGSTTTTRSS